MLEESFFFTQKTIPDLSGLTNTLNELWLDDAKAPVLLKADDEDK